MTRGLAPALAVAWAVSCGVLVGHAQDVPGSGPRAPDPAVLEEAKRAWAEGRKRYEAGDYDAALPLLEHAYELAPTPNILYNLGLLHVARGDFPSAVRAFERYLADGSRDGSDARRVEVEKRLADLSMHVGRAVVETHPDNAEITVDGRSAGRTPLSAPLLLSVGRHTIEAAKEGRIAVRKTFVVSGGETITLDVDLAEPAPLSQPVPTSSPPPSVLPTAQPPQLPPPAAGPPLWIGWTVTGALAAGGLVTGIAALAMSSDLQDQLAHPNPSADDTEAASHRVRALAITSDVLTASAVVVGGFTVYLTVKNARGQPGPARSGVRASVGPTGAKITGAF